MKSEAALCRRLSREVINVSVPAALSTALLLFRLDVAQCASKLISTIINSKLLQWALNPRRGKLNFVSPFKKASRQHQTKQTCDSTRVTTLA